MATTGARRALDTKAVAAALSAWFEVHARDLSWRRTRDPYAIWVSEIMLQQTRVETVENYWGRFIARFPDVGSLAAADEDAVLEQWSGLGYYRRARLLHRGAKYVHEQLDDALPRSAAELRAIPGVGPYTAGAIASIAFDQPAPLVDGNVARVHSRLAAIATPAEQDAKARHHWSFVEEVLGHGRPRVLAQALMELGATVCTPRSPSCASCPVQTHCRARARGLETEIPAAKKKKAVPELHFHALALRRGGRLLLERRGDTGLLAGMWCLPLFARTAPSASPKRGARPGLDVQREHLRASAHEQLGIALSLASTPEPAMIKHVFSHRIWHLQTWSAKARHAVKLAGRTDGRVLAWLDPGAAPEGGVPSVTRKLLSAL